MHSKPVAESLRCICPLFYRLVALEEFLPGITPHELDAIAGKYDSDGSGTYTLDEFIKVPPLPPNGCPHVWVAPD